MAEVKVEEGEVVVPVIEIDPITKLEEENAKLIEERDNYKAVALKRLGKLPGDAEFLDTTGNGELSVAEQVRLALLDREIATNEKAKKDETARLVKENSELRLAIKNRPGGSIGGEGGSGAEVKDNVFSEAQIAVLRQTASRLKADPEKFIEQAKKNLQARQ
jgi:hypothetical protein